VNVEVELESNADAAAAARHALDGLSRELGERRMHDVRLLVSELVTNAVRHAGLRAGDAIGLRVDIQPSLVRVEVRDLGLGFVPRPPRADPARTSGWGLYLVEQIADRWGVDGDGRGTQIWFELDG
jgi:anti-sigma regulatory factor (Ser/Thr protein kinase)